MSTLLKLASRGRIPSQTAAEETASRAASLMLEIEKLEIDYAVKTKERKEAHSKKIEELTAEADKLLDAMEFWLRSNEAELLSDKKRTIELRGHALSLRDNGGSVQVAPKKTLKWVVANLVAAAEEGDTTAEALIAIKTSLDKTAVERLAKDDPEALKAYHLRFEHEDIFTFTPAKA
jgi:phage host-nuclease inhibitor protein Gam